jgi:hypothetical protein
LKRCRRELAAGKDQKIEHTGGWDFGKELIAGKDWSIEYTVGLNCDRELHLQN